MDADKHTLCIDCLGGDHFADLKDRVCEQCMCLGDSIYRQRRHDWVHRQCDKFNIMLENEDGGGGASQAGSLAMSRSQGSLSQSRGRSVVSSGALSRSKARSQTQSKAQIEVEVALSEGDDEIFVTELEGAVVKNGDHMKPPISPIRALVQSPQPIPTSSPVPSLQSGQIPPPDNHGGRGSGWDGCGCLHPYSREVTGLMA